MAKASLLSNRKLPRLARLLGIPVAYAVGLLECLWHSQYAAASDFVGDAIDVETVARWEGESGKLAKALTDAGFLDAGPDGTYWVHDFWDHAPAYVETREKAQSDRKARGVTLSDIRAEAGRKGAEVTNARRKDGNRPANGRQIAGENAANDGRVAAPRDESANERQIAALPSLPSSPSFLPSPPPPPASPAGPAGPGDAREEDSPRRIAGGDPGDGPDGFAEFWDRYPGKAAEVAARAEWLRLSPVEREAALCAVVAFAEVWGNVPNDRHRFIPNAATWLRFRRWTEPREEWERQAAGPTPRPTPALVGAHSPSKAPEPDDDAPACPPPPPAPEGSENVLPAILGELREKVDEREFDRWLRPLRQAGPVNGQLAIVAPTLAAARVVRDDFLPEIATAAGRLGRPEPIRLFAEDGREVA